MGSRTTSTSRPTADWRIASTHVAGFKAEIFNLFNNEEKIINNNVAWCGSTANAGCVAAGQQLRQGDRARFVRPAAPLPPVVHLQVLERAGIRDQGSGISEVP